MNRAAILLLLLAGLARAEHEIRLHRPEKVGARYRIEGKGTFRETTTVTKEGQRVDEIDFEVGIELKAVVEIRKVDGNGRVLGCHIHVETLFFIEDGVRVRGRKLEGQTVTAHAVGDETIFKTVRTKITKETARLLDLLVGTDAGVFKALDAAFGSKTRRKVGESWAVDRKLVAAGFSEGDHEIKVDKIEGKTEVVEKTELNGVPCLRVRMHLRAWDFEIKDMPADMKVRRTEMKVKEEALFPLDVSRQMIWERNEIDLEATYENPGGIIETKTREVTTWTRTDLPPAKPR